MMRQAVGRATGGLAPSVLAGAMLDWAVQMAASPGRQAQLAEKALQHAVQLSHPLGATREALPQDRRFASPLWDLPPWNRMRDSFLLTDDWWQEATRDLRGLSPQSAAQVRFALRQALDAAAPPNFPHLNPEVLARAHETGGLSLLRGMQSVWEGFAHGASSTSGPDPDFPLGEVLATTPGKVVLRTHLMELIQYSPTTDMVQPEPVLIVPAWIMKYYILDLSRQNSLVSWLVAQGFTVFMISWRNPDAGDADLGMAEYLEQGPRAALDAVQAITGAARVHAAGYCLGGTLLTIMAADLARRGVDRLASVTLLAAQVDFTEPGELGLFISEAQVTLIEDLMAETGYLDGAQMAGAFTLLRSKDLFWSRFVREAMLGERDDPSDLMAWNADTTRMPFRMHSEYLRQLYLDNALANGRYRVDGHALSLSDIRAPVLAVGTESDHVAPWRSVWKIHHLTKGDVTFILTSGGHNAGIISEPGHPRRRFRIATVRAEDHPGDPQEWFDRIAPQDGSWWPVWADWLRECSGAPVVPPPMGEELGDAPGRYVLMR
jgi:polyhydroxyalkanoate synthase